MWAVGVAGVSALPIRKGWPRGRGHFVVLLTVAWDNVQHTQYAYSLMGVALKLLVSSLRRIEKGLRIVLNADLTIYCKFIKSLR